jgi:hypothetical protein
MKFVLLVEGHTEHRAIAEFIKRWLDPQLSRPVGVTPIRFQGYGDLMRDVANRTKMILNDPQAGQEVIAVISLLDFYGPTFSFPKGVAGTAARCAWAKNDIERRVGDERFRHFFAVHEFEAWLLSSPRIFPSAVQPHLPKKPPETVNNDNPPKSFSVSSTARIQGETTKKRLMVPTYSHALIRRKPLRSAQC